MNEGLKVISDFLSMSKINLIHFRFENTVNAENVPIANIIMHFGSFPHYDGDELLEVCFTNCTNISVSDELFNSVKRPSIMLYDVSDKEKKTTVCRVEEAAELFSFWCEEVTYMKI